MSFTSDIQLKTLSSLTNQEELALHAIEKTFSNPATPDQEKSLFLNWISRYPIKSLYAISKNSKTLKSLFETNVYLNFCWGSILTKKGYLFANVEPVDKKKKPSLFDQLMAALMVSELLAHAGSKNLDPYSPLLTEACQFGLFDALILRMNALEKMLTDTSHHKSANAETLSDALIHDAAKLGNLYWSIGHFNAGLILLNAAPNSTDMTSILKTAIEHIYTGLLLIDTKQSLSILQHNTKPTELFSLFGEDIKTPAQTQEFIIKQLTLMNIPSPDLFCLNAFNHAIKNINKFHPEVALPDSLEAFLTK